MISKYDEETVVDEPKHSGLIVGAVESLDECNECLARYNERLERLTSRLLGGGVSDKSKVRVDAQPGKTPGQLNTLADNIGELQGRIKELVEMIHRLESL